MQRWRLFVYECVDELSVYFSSKCNITSLVAALTYNIHIYSYENVILLLPLFNVRVRVLYIYCSVVYILYTIYLYIWMCVVQNTWMNDWIRMQMFLFLLLLLAILFHFISSSLAHLSILRNGSNIPYEAKIRCNNIVHI